MGGRRRERRQKKEEILLEHEELNGKKSPLGLAAFSQRKKEFNYQTAKKEKRIHIDTSIIFVEREKGCSGRNPEL